MHAARAALHGRWKLGRTQFLLEFRVGRQRVLQDVDHEIRLRVEDHQVAIDESILQFSR